MGSSAGFAAATDPVVLAAAIAAKLAVTQLEAVIPGVVETTVSNVISANIENQISATIANTVSANIENEIVASIVGEVSANIANEISATVANTLEQAQAINTLGVPSVRQVTTLGTFNTDGTAHTFPNVEGYSGIVISNSIPTASQKTARFAWSQSLNGNVIESEGFTGLGQIPVLGDSITVTPPNIPGSTYTASGVIVSTFPTARPEIIYEATINASTGFADNAYYPLTPYESPFNLYPSGKCSITGSVVQQGGVSSTPTIVYTRASGGGYIALPVTNVTTTVDVLLPNDVNGFFLHLAGASGTTYISTLSLLIITE